MKKIVNVLFLFVLVASLVIVFASCGQQPGGNNPGGDNPGGDNPGGDNPGGDNPGGDNPGGETETFTVKFYANGGVLETKTVVAGQCVEKPATDPVPRNEEDYFAGWNDGEEEPYDFSTPVTENLKLYAFFTNSYVIKFQDKDGGSLGSAEVIYKKNLKVEDIPVVPAAEPNYHFVGWEVDGNVISTKTLVEMQIDRLITAKAVYGLNTYLVTYKNANDGSILATSFVEAGKTASQITPAFGTISSYKVGGNEYDFSTPVTADIEILCTQVRDIWTITFVDKEQQTITTKKVYDGTNVALPIAQDKYYTCDPAAITCIRGDKTIVLSEVEKAAYTEGFEPNLKTDIVEKNVDWAKSGVTYYLSKVGQYFEYNGYFANEFVFNVCSGAQYQASKIVSTFKVTCDGVEVNQIKFGPFFCPGTTDSTPNTAFIVPAGEHTIRVELVATTFDPAFMPVGGNPNDYGIGVNKVVTNQDLSKVFYTVNFVNNYDDPVFAENQKGTVASLQVMYGTTPTLPVLPGALHEEVEDGIETGGEEFDGWWDADGLFSFVEGNQPTFENKTWYVKYTMKKTYDVTFKDKTTGDVIKVSNTLWGDNAELPQDATYYYVVDTEDVAKIYGVKGAATVFVTPVKKSNYIQQSIVLTKVEMDGAKWTKYEVTPTSTNPEEIAGPAIQNYATMMYKVGQRVTVTGNFAGPVRISLNADKPGQEYKIRYYIDDVVAWTSDLIYSDDYTINNGKGHWVGIGTVNIPEVCAGVHTIAIELVYANDDKCETKLQSWAALAFSQIIVMAQ